MSLSGLPVQGVREMKRAAMDMKRAEDALGEEPCRCRDSFTITTASATVVPCRSRVSRSREVSLEKVRTVLETVSETHHLLDSTIVRAAFRDSRIASS